MASYKGVTTLLQAFRLLAERWPDCPTLQFAGEGPLKEPLIQEMRDSRSRARWSFWGSDRMCRN
ncbi:hypothetical protein [Verrucomicrobium spinosum]|uniref:hypothetical protein n=1 Tax=Verrucomicrobium spinosum TaxID=2736 RepID=UPI000B200959|nr:hypothetical protein [Verrucomicrobium spinosum]